MEPELEFQFCPKVHFLTHFRHPKSTFAPEIFSCFRLDAVQAVSETIFQASYLTDAELTDDGETAPRVKAKTIINIDLATGRTVYKPLYHL